MTNRTDNNDDLKRMNENARNSLLDRLRGLLGLAPASVREDIEDALEEATGDVSPHERALLKNVLSLHDLRVQDAMIPRADIIAISQDLSLRHALHLFQEAGHSRLPVYADTLDDPRGMIHIRDFINIIAQSVGLNEDAQSVGEARVSTLDFNAPISSANLLKPVLFVPSAMPALDLLIRMQATRTHLALVIDEYGGTDGLVTIEDIMEMIVGDIEDEHETLGVDFRMEDTPPEVTTIGGLVAWLAGRVPMRAEIIPTPIEAYEFEIIDADPRRVAKLRVRARPKS